VTIVVNAPFAKLPWVGNVGRLGATYAADEINGSGGLRIGGTSYRLRVVTMDNDLSAATSLENVRRAADLRAAAVIDDGYTAAAAYSSAERANLPVLVYYDGTVGLVDSVHRPALFRVAPADDAVANRLAPYVATHSSRIALLHDDTDYGRDGDAEVRRALRKAGIAPMLDAELPASAGDFAPQAVQVVQSAATAVVVWARAPVLAAALRSLRQAGSELPVFTGPTGEDPVVRAQLASHPEWLAGVTFASFRVTSEEGPASWERFRRGYEAKFGRYRTGLQTTDRRPVYQPPDWQMFPYDIVYMVKAGLEKARTPDASSGAEVQALTQVEIKAANGDHRGWKRDDHEGVSDNDIYFASFHDFQFRPVQDDPLSRSLPPVQQT
jgi:ABC-type branched-subunit amino acid transport system substrate-binding protein